MFIEVVGQSIPVLINTIQADVRKRESMSALQCSPTKKKLRNLLTDFDWTNTCFICDKQANKAAESKKTASDQQIISMYKTIQLKKVF